MPRMTRMLAAIVLGLVLPVAAFAADMPPKKIVFLAGPLDAGHPRGTHEYERTAALLKLALDTSTSAGEVTTELHTGGWPSDLSTLDDADTIVVIGSGSDRNETD